MGEGEAGADDLLAVWGFGCLVGDDEGVVGVCEGEECGS